MALAAIQRPADCLVFGDSATLSGGVVKETLALFPPSSTVRFNFPLSQFRHNGQTNVVFADSHVKSLAPLLRSANAAQLLSTPFGETLWSWDAPEGHPREMK